MGLNDTVSAERLHIGFFGMRNAGKSSIVNAVTGQELSVVSDVRGTTTDPVKKAMELLPLGPVLIIDTPGLDDEGSLGALRVKRARRILSQVDIAVLVIDAQAGPSPLDLELLAQLQERNLPYIIAWNKADLLTVRKAEPDHGLYVSAATGENIQALKERIGALAQNGAREKYIVSDLLKPGATVVLVIPIDSAAPRGRLILPQQLTIRDILDAGCSVVATRDSELAETLQKLSVPPDLVITDSQVFGKVARIVPEDVPLTSFSILFARYKGELAELVRGAAKLSNLQDGDRVLISEGCTHHRQCGDIGTVKMPAWIGGFSHAKVTFSFTAGGDFPEDLSPYSLVVHCGGCMLNEKEMKLRIRRSAEEGVPIVNYGIAIARIHGILERSLQIFPRMQALLQGEFRA